MIPLFAVVPGRNHPSRVLGCEVAMCVCCESLCLADEKKAPQTMNLHEISFSKQENLPFTLKFNVTLVLCQQEFQEPLQRPEISRLPNMSTTVSGFAAKVKVQNKNQRTVKPVILPILNVFGLPKKKISAQRQSPPPVLEEAF